MIEYRPAVGDDLGELPAVVIHSLDRYRPLAPGSPDIRTIIFEGVIIMPKGGSYTMPEKDVTISCPETNYDSEFIVLTIHAQLKIDVTNRYRLLLGEYQGKQLHRRIK